MFSFGAARVRRRPSLTPMIDVVFLLLVFFMLASRFGHEAEQPLALAAAPGGQWQGPPRLIDLEDGGLRLNGVAVPSADLLAQLAPLMATPTDPVILRARGGTVQDLVTLSETLRDAGITQLVVVP
ncbi:MAG: biopolymer transporter ExbD [Paracoccaceae bacterium]|jgi:biopolymer transport protein ExbD|nr:biopolymer transporter ExbD [Paracoccaceae bacterium]